jgi:hypothetical protein
MTLKEARQYIKAWPERFRIIAKFVRGDDENMALFMFKLEEKREESMNYTEVYNSHPLGMRRNVDFRGIGEYLHW